MTSGQAPIASGERLTRSNIGLIAMLAIVVMFEGFDISLTSVVLPYLGAEFGASAEVLGRGLGIIALGSIAAWILIRLSDRFGRRPVLLLAAGGFSLGSLATVLTFSVHSYIAIQFVARLFMVTQIAVAYLLISEIIPPSLRGRVNGVLGAAGSFGAALPFLALAPALSTGWGWRTLFVIGALPLLMMPLLIAKLPETQVWKEARARGTQQLSALDEIRTLAGKTLRGRFVTMSLLWFIINFASSTSGLFFTLYVVQERHWSPGDFAQLAPLALGGAFLGYLAAGMAMDLIGRRYTVIAFMALLGGLTQYCYTAQGWWQIAGAFVGLQAMLGVWVVAYTLNSELFPTKLRGAANGWCHNLIGRWGVVLAPWILGALTATMGGIGPAASVLGCVAYLAIPLVWFGLPETRGQVLDEAKFAGEV